MTDLLKVPIAASGPRGTPDGVAAEGLATYPRTELALRLKGLIEKEAKQRQREHGGTTPGKSESLSQNSDEVSEPPRSDEALGELAGVSRDTVRKVEVLDREATEWLREFTASRNGEPERPARNGSEKGAFRVNSGTRRPVFAPVPLRGPWPSASEGATRGHTGAQWGSHYAPNGSTSRRARKCRTRGEVPR